MEAPKTQYARSGDVFIAYQIVGEGPFDLVLIPGFVSHLDLAWEMPGCVRLLRRLASFSRLISFDKRGTGLSDRAADLPSMEERMDDVRAVMDAAGSEKAAIFGISEGGSLSVLFSATHPERTRALVMYGSFARFLRAEDYPWGLTEEQVETVIQRYQDHWGEGMMMPFLSPSRAGDQEEKRLMQRFERMGASPSAAMRVIQMNAEIDVRAVLPSVRVPTLVLHRTGDRLIRPGAGRFLAEHIPGAKYVELPGIDHAFWSGDVDSIADEVEVFLTGTRASAEVDRVLATVLFTDIVDSTARAAELGDRRWKELLERHHAIARREMARFHGREIDAAGDGFLVAFDGPARAIRCACAIREAVKPLGLEIRAGLHTGECERLGEGLSGIAVHIGARVAALAAAGEVLISRTVKDLVAGSGLRFSDRGRHELKGIPGEWNLFAVEA